MPAVLTIPVVDFAIPYEIVILGVITGLIYALLGMGITLVYKSTRVINFAHGETGAIAATMFIYLSLDQNLPYGMALVGALGAGAAAGVLLELLVIRRLANAPRLIVLVATIAAAQVLLAANVWIPRPAFQPGMSFPTPFEASLTIGSLELHAAELLMLAMVPLLTLALTLFLRKSRMGLGARAAAENLRAARLTGVPARRVSIAIWVIAALLSAASAILVGPTRSLAATQALGPALMIRALAAAMIGGLTSIPGVFIGGLVVGVLELLVSYNYPTGGLLELVIFAVIIVSMFIRKDLGRIARGKDDTSWSLGGAVHPLEPRLARMPRVRIAKGVLLVGVVAIAVFGTGSFDSGKMVLLSSITLFAVMGLSVTVLTGYTGQISLGQFAFVGLGAVVGGRLFQLGMSVEVCILLTMAVGGAAAFVVGLPGLRVRGSFLAVSTLAFAVAAGSWLLRQNWLVVVEGGRTSLRLPRLDLYGLNLRDERTFFYLCLGLLVVVATIVSHLRSTGFGRRLFAVRDNEAAAATLSIPPRRVKLTGFVISGSIASLAGYFYGWLLVNFASANLFSPSDSLALVVMVIFGGVTSVTGTILGALWVRGIPFFFGSRFGILSSGIGVLLVLQLLPGGLARLAFELKDRFVRLIIGERAGPPPIESAVARPPLSPAPPFVGDRHPIPIQAIDIKVRFGGVVAVDSVSIEAHRGEIVGVVGPNGAGKTTLFDVLTGQIRATEGKVLLDGRDISGLRPEQRARLGLGRSFQEARLYPEVSLIDTFKLALERNEPSGAVSSLFGLPHARSAERRKQKRAEEILELLGLGRFAYLNCSELSTGTRRFAELGCLVAMGCQVMLLDEPAAGFAQREVEAFTPVLREIRDHLDATMVVIDHDVPMMLGLVDRLYVMSVGQVIAEGEPRTVAEDPFVIAAYLGTDERAINRSGRLGTAASTASTMTAETTS